MVLLSFLLRINRLNPVVDNDRFVNGGLDLILVLESEEEQIRVAHFEYAR